MGRSRRMRRETELGLQLVRIEAVGCQLRGAPVGGRFMEVVGGRFMEVMGLACSSGFAWHKPALGRLHGNRAKEDRAIEQ